MLYHLSRRVTAHLALSGDTEIDGSLPDPTVPLLSSCILLVAVCNYSSRQGAALVWGGSKIVKELIMVRMTTGTGLPVIILKES